MLPPWAARSTWPGEGGGPCRYSLAPSRLRRLPLLPHRLGDAVRRAANSGYSVNGSFAEFACRSQLCRPDPRRACRWSCGPSAGVTVYKGLQETEVKPGEWGVVSGVGGLGHMAVQYARSWACMSRPSTSIHRRGRCCGRHWLFLGRRRAPLPRKRLSLFGGRSQRCGCWGRQCYRFWRSVQSQ